VERGALSRPGPVTWAVALALSAGLHVAAALALSPKAVAPPRAAPPHGEVVPFHVLVLSPLRAEGAAAPQAAPGPPARVAEGVHALHASAASEPQPAREAEVRRASPAPAPGSAPAAERATSASEAAAPPGPEAAPERTATAAAPSGDSEPGAGAGVSPAGPGPAAGSGGTRPAGPAGTGEAGGGDGDALLATLHARLSTAAARCAPPAARRYGTRGEVHLSFCLGPGGAVVQVEVLRSSGSAPLDQAATACVVPGAAPFPAEAAGRCFQVPVRF
jgi:TonB family protein